MTLTQQERERFAEYLEKGADDDERLIEQLHNVKPIPALIDKLRREVVAARLVAAKLRLTEDA